ncbi:acyl carrier protein, partial [Streptomyces sp. URMC 127]|uniref:acyl carrier protein n=1 Tax=Streptomyces sp. URMC 127 TaxID=3423402 RepID=UPI003F1957F5
LDPLAPLDFPFDDALFDDGFDGFDGFDDLSGPAGTEAGAPEVTPPDLRLLAVTGLAERRVILETYVRQELGRVLGVPPHTIDTTGRPMNSLGVGSIMGLELQRRMEDALQVEVDLQRLLRANSAAELIDCLAGQLGDDEDDPHRRASRRPAPPQAPAGAA